MLTDERKCPTCAETIKREAIKCRFCGESVTPIPVTIAPIKSEPQVSTATSQVAPPPTMPERNVKSGPTAFKPGCLTWFLILFGAFIVLLIVGSFLPNVPETSTATRSEDAAKSSENVQESAAEVAPEVAKPTTIKDADEPDLGIKPERFRFNFNQSANLFKTGLYIKKTEVRVVHGVRTFTAQVNKNLGVGGTLSKKGTLTSVEFFGSGNGTLVSGANVIIALAQFICAVDPESSGDERNKIMQDLGLLGDDVDVENLHGSSTLHGKRYSSAHTSDVPLLVVATPSG